MLRGFFILQGVGTSCEITEEGREKSRILKSKACAKFKITGHKQRRSPQRGVFCEGVDKNPRYLYNILVAREAAYVIH